MRFSARLLLALLVLPLLVACDQSPEKTIASAEQHIANREYRTAVVELKSLLQRDARNPTARWLLGTVYLEMEDGASAEKEFRQARELGIADDAVLPALSQALLLQNRADDVLALEAQGELSQLSRGELDASRALAMSAKGNREDAVHLMATAAKSAPYSPWVRYAEASLSVLAGSVDEASQQLEALVKDVPEHGQAWSLIGNLAELEKDYSTAEMAYSNAIDHRSVHSADTYRRGLIRLAQDHTEAALADADRLLKLAPKSYTTYYLRGVVLARQGEVSEAEAALEEAYSLNGAHFQTVLVLASIHDKLGNAQRALAMAERAFGINQNSTLARKLLAGLYLRNGKAMEAETLLVPAVAADDEDIQAKDLLASSLVQQGKLEEALAVFAELAGTRQTNSADHLRVGAVMLALDRLEQGVQAMQLAMDLAPTDKEMSSAIVTTLLRANQAHAAMAAAQQFVESNPEVSDAWTLIGLAKLAVGEKDEAVAAFEKALQVDPSDVEANLQLSKLKRGKGDVVGAKSLLERSSDFTPDSPDLVFELALLEDKLGNVDRAKELLLRTIDLVPGQLQPRLALAQIYSRRGEHEKVLEAIGTPAFLDNPGALQLQANAFLQTGQLIEARDALNMLITFVPNEVGVLGQLARIHSQLGNHEESLRVLSQVLELHPKNAELTLVMANSLLALGRTEQAADLLGQVSLPSNDPDLLATRYVLARQQSDYEGMRDSAGALYEQRPSTESLLAFVSSQIALNNPQEAEQHIRGWLDRHPSDAAVARVLAQLMLRLGKRSEAIEAHLVLDRLKPDDSSTLNNLAALYMDADPKLALNYAERAVLLNGQSVAAMDTYAAVLLENGQEKQALNMMRRAVDRSNNDPRMMLRLVELLRKAGKNEEALFELEALLDGSYSAPEAVAKRAEELRRLWSAGEK